MTRILAASLQAIAAVAVISGTAQAEGVFEEDFQALLEVGKHAEAADMARAELAKNAGDGAAQFALGSAQFLGAVGNLMQGLHRYGLRSEERIGNFAGMIQMPFLRLPVPDNDAPEPVSYEALNALLANFVDDLAIAEATLSGVGDASFTLMLDLDRIGFDVDADGAVQDGEGLISVLTAVAGMPPPRRAPGGFTVGFDQSDAPWLGGYSHLLSAMAEFPLAYDWSRAYELTFHNLFNGIETESAEIAVEENRLLDLLMTADQSATPPQWDSNLSARENSRRKREWRESPEGKSWEARWDAEMALEYGAIADLVAFMHLFDWPVVQPDRMRSARQHLLSMVALSRENWRRIRAETDDDHEWVPGPHQTNVINRMRVDGVRLEAWMMFLDEFQAVLEGRKLLPHWRFGGNRGVNLRRVFDEPAAMDPVLIAQGVAVLPFLEEGEIADSQTFLTIMEMLDGGLLAYFIWFN